MQTSYHASIGIVLPYFGKLPNYFPLFLESCKNNPSIDWLFYTDCDENISYPDNFKVHKLSFSDFCLRLQDSFDFPISLDSPYKLCDFKPTYGDTLASDLIGYDFWGHCDCDLIFGNIRKFITNSITDQFDRIGNCGHLILYRNQPEINRYYRTQKYIDYQSILQSPKIHAFDEWPGISGCWQNDGRACFGDLCYDDISNGIADFRPTQIYPGGYIGPYHGEPDESFRFARMKNISYVYENGTLRRYWNERGILKHEETMYVHFQKRKMQFDDKISHNFFFAVPNAFIAPIPLSSSVLKSISPQSRHQSTYIRLLKNWCKILFCEIINIGKRNYSQNSVIISYIRTYFK